MANEPTIAEMNITIADFMGYHYMASKFYSKERGTKPNCFKEAKYHTSWDWLMPVGKKIYDLLAEMAKQRPPHTACHGDMIEVDITCHIREYNITGAHKSIYEFTQWFNQQKQNDE